MYYAGSEIRDLRTKSRVSASAWLSSKLQARSDLSGQRSQRCQGLRLSVGQPVASRQSTLRWALDGWTDGGPEASPRRDARSAMRQRAGGIGALTGPLAHWRTAAGGGTKFSKLGSCLDLRYLSRPPPSRHIDSKGQHGSRSVEISYITFCQALELTKREKRQWSPL